jgi:predicted alpha/beta-hydrolase family hydrolase
VAVDHELTATGWIVERVDLAFRLSGKPGPPRAADQARDREVLAEQLADLRKRIGGPVYFGGHSYGGRQGSMLLAEQPDLADGLLLMSYPLHPPGKPDQLRIEHLPSLKVPVLLVSGSKDEFGTVEELTNAVDLIGSKRKRLSIVEGARHDLKSGKSGVAKKIAQEFTEFCG